MKRILIIAFLAAVLLTTLGLRPVEAASTCPANYTVQRGDYLTKIARQCGTTTQALANANPWIRNWNLIYPGQVLAIPGGIPPTGGSYTVQPGDTLRKIAARYNITLDSLIKANPEIANPNRIYVGQVIRLPAGASQDQGYTVQRGDYLRSIAARFNTNVAAILNANPAITNPGLIYPGQVIAIPSGNVPTVAIAPRSGPAGSKIFVVAGGFPANQDVAVDLGLQGQAVSTVLNVRTDSTGYINKQITLTPEARSGEKWVVQVRTTGLASNISVLSMPFTVQ